MPEGTVDVIPVDLVVGRHHRRRRARARRRAADHPGRVAARSTRSSTGCWSTTSRRGSPSTRCTTPRASRSSCPSGASPAGAGCRASSTGPRRCSTADREGAAGAAAARASRPSGRPGSRRSASRSSGPSSTSSCTALYAECEAIYRVDHLLAIARRRWTPTDRDDVRLRPARHRLADATSRDDPPAVGRRARPRQDHARARRSTDRADRLRAQRAVARPPRRRVRPREHADRQQRRRELLVAGHPPARHAASGCATSLRTLAEAPGLLALDRKDRGDFLRFFYRRYEDAPGRADRRGRARAVQRS